MISYDMTRTVIAKTELGRISFPANRFENPKLFHKSNIQGTMSCST